MRSCSVRLVRCLRDFTSSMCCGKRETPFALDKYKNNDHLIIMLSAISLFIPSAGHP